jgi:hypothetical protein
MQFLHERLKPYARSIPCGELWLPVGIVTLMSKNNLISGLPHKGIPLGCLSPDCIGRHYHAGLLGGKGAERPLPYPVPPIEKEVEDGTMEIF